MFVAPDDCDRRASGKDGSTGGSGPSERVMTVGLVQIAVVFSVAAELWFLKGRLGWLLTLACAKRFLNDLRDVLRAFAGLLQDLLMATKAVCDEDFLISHFAHIREQDSLAAFY